MRFVDWCAACFLADPLRPPVRTIAEVEEEGSYVAVCPAGHRATGVLANPVYELLFDAGMLAAEDGYCREAVFDFSASLERYYVHYARVVARLAGATRDGVGNLFGKTISLSERQYGAFCFSHLLQTGRQTPSDEKQRAFRNKVVHGGLMPSKEETLQCARSVFETIRALEATIAPALGSERDWARYGRHRDCLREEREAATSRLWRREVHDVPREGLPEQHEAKTLLSATDTFDAAVAQWQSGKLWVKGAER